MLRISLLGALLALGFNSTVQAQYTGSINNGIPYYFANSDFYPFNTHLVTEKYKGKTIEYVGYNKKGKESYRSQTILNEKGKIVRTYRLKDNRRMLVSSNHYFRDSLLQEKTEFKKGKMHASMVMSYNDNYQILAQENFKRGKLQFSSEMSYNEGQLVKSQWYSGKKRKKSSLYEYEYFGNNQRKETRMYNRKGELKSRIRYECKDEGSDELKKNEKMVCIYEEGEKDYFKTIHYTKTRKGNTKQVTVYRASDSSLVELKRFNEKDEMTSLFKYDPETRNMTSNEYFRKGKLRFASYFKYEGVLLKEKSYKNAKGKGSKTVYTYTEDGAPLTFTQYDRNNKRINSGTIQVIQEN